MISFVEGVVSGREDGAAVLDVSGVGLRVQLGPESLAKVPPNGTKIKVWTHLAVSQFSWALYGFLTREEYELFALFLNVPGLGPRRVLGMVDGVNPSEARHAIEAEDAEGLARLCGVSAATAEKIVLNLRRHIAPARRRPAASEKGEGGADRALVEEALVSLGHTKAEARRAASETSGPTVEAWVRAALQRTRT